MTHLYYGDPSEEFSIKLAQTLVASGADILEIGVPYSDPVSDGEVFQRACKRALKNNVTPLIVFEGIRTLRNTGVKNYIYVTSYFGPIYKMGVEKFIKSVKDVGVQGVIIPDLLFEEQTELLQIAKKYKIEIIQFVTPYSSEERIQKIVKNAQGFIYYVSVPGVTGVRETVAKETIEFIRRLKKYTSLPIFVGFGISTPKQVNAVIQVGVGGVIVGSAIGKIYEQYLNDPERSLLEIATFTKLLKGGTI